MPHGFVRVRVTLRMKNRDTDVPVSRPTLNFVSWLLPSEVSERLVSVGHAVSVFPLGVGNAFFLVGGQ